jgi:hypothetical protein
MLQRPAPGEYAPFYAGYVERVPEADVLAALERQPREVADLARRVPPERETHRYAPGKWSVREVFGHVLDAERVFAYRALAFARGDAAALPGFDEKLWTPAAGHDRCALADLASEFAQLRAANVLMLSRLTPEDWERRGTASGALVTVRALAYIMAGHVRHHLAVLRERYGAGETTPA